LNKSKGLTSVDDDVNKFEERLSSSSNLNSFKSSGKVTKLLPYRSKVFSLLREYRLLILAGEIELYERFKISSLGKSSTVISGII
jgi:hypothetical protein